MNRQCDTVELFLEKVVLGGAPALLVLMLTNPMGFDKTQLISATGIIIFAAVFAGHTIKKPKPAPSESSTISDLRAEIDGLKGKLNHAAKNQSIREQLGVFLSVARKLAESFTGTDPSGETLRRKQNWEREVSKYLLERQDSSYQARFDNTNPTMFDIATPQAVPVELKPQWVDLTLKTILLQQFIDQLRD